MPNVLTDEQVECWRRDGAIWPIDLLTPEEAGEYAKRFKALEDSIDGEVQDRFRIKAHLPFPWLWDLIRHPRLADVVEDLLGPDIVCWGSSFFTKKAHDPRFVSWHQDTTYYGLEPPESITAWIAFTRSDTESGCMRFIPGSHAAATVLPHDETHDAENLLARGQTIHEIDESTATEMPLEPGQMSIHHNMTVHSSEPNRADYARIGFAIHLVSADVRQVHFDGALGIRLRGEDRNGNWTEDPPPAYEMAPESLAAVDEYWLRYKNAMPARA